MASEFGDRLRNSDRPLLGPQKPGWVKKGAAVYHPVKGTRVLIQGVKGCKVWLGGMGHSNPFFPRKVCKVLYFAWHLQQAPKLEDEDL